MLERRQQELDLVASKYGEIVRDTDLNWFVVKDWPLPTGWNKTKTDVLVLIPSGYPVTPPDNFYTENDLRLANGSTPQNASLDQRPGGQDQTWLMFSYHVESGDWQPHTNIREGHNLLTFLKGVAQRLSEAE